MRLVTALSLITFVHTAWAQPAPKAAPTSIEATKLRGGFGFIEGPAADADGNIYFVDMSTSKLYRLDSHGALDTVLEKTESGAGLMFDKSGRLFMTQFGGAKLVEVDLAKRALKTIADSFEGKPFSNCNDLTIDSQGGIYFTDPLYKAPPHPQGKQSVYYASPEKDSKRTITRAMDDDNRPNGVLLSPDEKTLYVVPAGRPALVAFPITSPGTLGDKKEVVLPGTGDGLAVDASGNIYVALPGSKLIQEIKSDLTLGQSWSVPEGPANCEFGGTKLDTLFITARSGIYALPLGVKGYRLTTSPALGAEFSDVPSQTFSDLPDAALIKALKAGGNIVFFRHGKSDQSQKDVAGSTDRAQQRNLSSEGKTEIEAIAASLKSLEITFTTAETSPMFRARDTAEILFGKPATDTPGLASGSGKEISSLLFRAPTSGNTLLVGHSNTVGPALPPQVRRSDEGHCLIYSTNDKGTFKCVAYLSAADWARLAKLPK